MINKPTFALFISMISVSFSAVLIKTSSAYALYPLSIAFYRLLFTVLLITPYILSSKKIRDELANIPLKTFIIMFIIGIVLSFHFSFWITSLTMTTIASSVLLVSIHPLLVGPVSHFFFHEKLSIFNVLGIIISIFGMTILVLGNEYLSLNINTFMGNILAILGGITAGIYILGGRKVRKNVSIGSYAFIIYSVSTIMLFFICIFSNSPIYNDEIIGDFRIILLMALIPGILGHTLYNWSLQYVRASIVSVSLLVEPVGASLLAFVIPWIHEIPSHFTIMGGCIILFGIYLTAKNPKSKIDYSISTED